MTCPSCAALGLVPAGSEGRVTNVVVQLLSLVPLGGRWLRASWAGALSLSLCSVLIYLLARRVLERSVHTPRLTPSLSLAAALIATLSQSFQLEGTVAGGAPLPSALVLFGLWLGLESLKQRDARLSLALGALVALTLSESHAAVLVLLRHLAGAGRGPLGPAAVTRGAGVSSRISGVFGPQLPSPLGAADGRPKRRGLWARLARLEFGGGRRERATNHRPLGLAGRCGRDFVWACTRWYAGGSAAQVDARRFAAPLGLGAR